MNGAGLSALAFARNFSFSFRSNNQAALLQCTLKYVMRPLETGSMMPMALHNYEVTSMLGASYWTHNQLISPSKGQRGLLNSFTFEAASGDLSDSLCAPHAIADCFS